MKRRTKIRSKSTFIFNFLFYYAVFSQEISPAETASDVKKVLENCSTEAAVTVAAQQNDNERRFSENDEAESPNGKFLTSIKEESGKRIKTDPTGWVQTRWTNDDDDDPKIKIRWRGKGLLNESHSNYHPPSAANINFEKRPCPVCKMEVETWKALEDHGVNHHPGVKMMKCPECPKAYARRFSYTKHAKEKHGCFISHKSAYVCEHCNKKISGLQEYNKHGKEEHPGKAMYQCQECGHDCLSRNTLLNHIYRRHRPNILLCPVCQKCYYSTTGCLKRHERVCRKKQRKIEKFRREGLPVQYCKVCDKEYYMKLVVFKAHVKRHDRYDNCPICDEGFDRYKNPCALAVHIRLRHSKSTDYNDPLANEDVLRMIKTEDEDYEYEEKIIIDNNA